MEESQPFTKSPIFWGVLATLAIFGLGFWSFNLPACFVLADGTTVCTSKWFYLTRATPNELGDTLAGFAGTLAFVWIIVTVAMQSRELEAQRKELQYTRLEYRSMRKIQDEQLQIVREARTGEQFEALLQAIREFEFYYQFGWEFEPYEPPASGFNPRVKFEPNARSGTEDRVRELSQRFQHTVEKLRDHLRGARLVNPYSGPTYKLTSFQSLTERTFEIEDELSPAKKALFDALEVRALHNAVVDFNSGNWWSHDK